MNKACVAGFIVLLAAAAVVRAQEIPEFPKPGKEHQWLGQLVGEWDTEGELFMEPGQPPLKTKGTESVRAIGGFWVLAENKGDFLGQPFTGLLTLGYDAEKKQYVGTWVDSMTGYLWTYEGAVDNAGKVLTLETEGPCPDRPGELSNFKEVLEIKSKDHKVFTSSMQGEDGTWTKMMTINYRRKNPGGPQPPRIGFEARPGGR
ncbi:MAG TPA: DUF1579 domain-containing protein [Planctomycetaceae bacterium]|nr:DUF1579 domain-containing protein [Planctomycetaceae bacterium]